MIIRFPLLFIALVVGSMPPSEGQHMGEMEEEAMTPCYRFKEGDPEWMEFYSPNYPNPYPGAIDCYKILEAPEGYYVELDFRDGFHIEPASKGCKFDFLEVRDGSQGYSPLIDKYCGHEYPPVIASSGRHLWLHFHSDGNTQYTGFRAVYQYIPRPTTETDNLLDILNCKYEMSDIEGIINITKIIEKRRELSIYQPVDCIWVIQVEPAWKIQLGFLNFTLSMPNECNDNFLDVFAEKTDIPSRKKNFCGSQAELMLSESDILTLRFFASARAVMSKKISKVVLLYTAFKEKPKGGSCEEGLYDCEDGNCISYSLRCNKRYNCRYRWDEDDRECTTKKTVMERIIETDYMAAILVLFFIILFGMCCSFLYHCIKKLIRDHRIIREQMMKSREAKLEQLGKKTPAGAVMTPLVALVGKKNERYGNWPNHKPRENGNDEEEEDAEEGRSVQEPVVVHGVREVEIQTRDSLFHSPGPTPPPRPTFTTFGYDSSEETVRGEDPRATSMESTKSAPDVIMSH